ncbi:hypothetical protein WT83_27845 [Burkholderia territorii]|uniref:Uncharacterized protein n=2 Tax=Burkholderia territorii TaxID=1503055 RepID=A0A119VDH3_9BURK|nr:hypothetical protein WT27_13745 [Burkholderia territorii]KVX33925.1 hypothetical protein WT31_09650 [Burkholderia territorii]KWN05898.1 hypothetical protein WT83_27845 [Burkholderia territorii]
MNAFPSTFQPAYRGEPSRSYFMSHDNGDILQPFKFKVGDIVCWTNDYGVKWRGRRIVEVDRDAKSRPLYYLEPTDAPWMYVREPNLVYETMSLTQLQDQSRYDYSLRQRAQRDPGYLPSIARAIATQPGTVNSPSESPI